MVYNVIDLIVFFFHGNDQGCTFNNYSDANRAQLNWAIPEQRYTAMEELLINLDGFLAKISLFHDSLATALIFNGFLMGHKQFNCISVARHLEGVETSNLIYKN